MSNTRIVAVAVFLLALACVPTDFPIAYSEWALVIAVTFLGPLLLGYLGKKAGFIILLTALYLPAGMYVPRYLQDKLAKKVELPDYLLAAVYLFFVGLAIGLIMTYAGRLLKKFVRH